MIELKILKELYIQLFEEYLSSGAKILDFEKKFYGLYLNRDEREDLPKTPEEFEIFEGLDEILQPFFWSIEAFHPNNTEKEEVEDPSTYSTEKTVRKNAEETLEKLKALKND